MTPASWHISRDFSGYGTANTLGGWVEHLSQKEHAAYVTRGDRRVRVATCLTAAAARAAVERHLGHEKEWSACWRTALTEALPPIRLVHDGV